MMNDVQREYWFIPNQNDDVPTIRPTLCLPEATNIIVTVILHDLTQQ